MLPKIMNFSRKLEYARYPGLTQVVHIFLVNIKAVENYETTTVISLLKPFLDFVTEE